MLVSRIEKTIFLIGVIVNYQIIRDQMGIFGIYVVYFGMKCKLIKIATDDSYIKEEYLE